MKVKEHRLHRIWWVKVMIISSPHWQIVRKKCQKRKVGGETWCPRLVEAACDLLKNSNEKIIE